MTVTLRRGDALAALRAMPDACIDAVVCDPPYGLAAHRPDVVTAAVVAWAQGDRERVPTGAQGGFMGRAWDGFVPPPAVWDECLRVLKPGGHLVAFAGSRTADLMGLSIRLAGFEIRDGLAWLYGSGFPKSLDVSKAITATERHGGANSVRIRRARLGADYMPSGRAGNRVGLGTASNHLGTDPTRHVETELTENAQQWQGWGTALKPAHEPIVLARKPLGGTVAATVLAHGTGALNIDGCRVTMSDADRAAARVPMGEWTQGGTTGATAQREGRVFEPAEGGRWPSNVLLSHGEGCADVCAPGCPVAELERQGEGTRAAKASAGGSGGQAPNAIYGGGKGLPPRTDPVKTYDTGASRFFPTFRYQAKAPARERPKVDGVAHPTVKPLALMAWLVRLVTPPGGIVLDPFAGSGTTLQAARDEGFAAVGVESFPDYWPLIRARLGDALVETDVEISAPPDEPASVVPALIAAATTEEALNELYDLHAADWRQDWTDAVVARLAALDIAAVAS